MTSDPHRADDLAPAEALRRAAADAVAALTAAGCPPDGLGAYEPPRRRLFGTRPARIIRVGSGWRLGVLVVASDGAVFSGGSTLRAHVPPPVKGYTADSARERDELRHCAIRGGFAEGETVHWALEPVVAEAVGASTSPLALRDGRLVVRWAPRAPIAGAPSLEAYLAERAGLLAATAAP